jgi:hypothetical protein
VPFQGAVFLFSVIGFPPPPRLRRTRQFSVGILDDWHPSERKSPRHGATEENSPWKGWEILAQGFSPGLAPQEASL